MHLMQRGGDVWSRLKLFFEIYTSSQRYLAADSSLSIYSAFSTPVTESLMVSAVKT